MANDEVIVFENLRQKSSVVGEQSEVVKAKAKPFVASNAHGVLRQAKDFNEIRELGSAIGRKTLAVIASR